MCRYLDPNRNDQNIREKLTSLLWCWATGMLYIPARSYQVGAHMHVFSHINSPSSVVWHLQKEVNTVNQEDILSNLSQFPWPPLEGMQKKQKWSVQVSALYLGKRQSAHRFSKLYRNPSFPKEAKGDANEQLLSLDFYNLENLKSTTSEELMNDSLHQ